MVRPIKSNKELTRSRLRSAISNGSERFRGVDHRSSSIRRFKDILLDLTDALGGEEQLSPQEKILLWKASCLILWMELIEGAWFRLDTDEPPSIWVLKTYNTITNNLRRIFRDLGLKRVRELPRGTTFTHEEVVANLEQFGLPAGGEFDPPASREQMQRPVTSQADRVMQKLKDAADAK